MYSLDEENYHGCQPTQEASIIEAIKEDNLIHGDTVYISKMELIKAPNFDSFMSADDIFEKADEHISDNYFAEDPLFNQTPEHEKSLMETLNNAWFDFIKANPKVMRVYYNAIDPTKIEIDPEQIQQAER